VHRFQVVVALSALVPLAACRSSPTLVETGTVSFPDEVVPTAITPDHRGGYCLAYSHLKTTDTDAYLACVGADGHGYLGLGLISGEWDYISDVRVLSEGAIAIGGYLGAGGMGLVPEWPRGSSFVAVIDRSGQARWVVGSESEVRTLWSEGDRLWAGVGTDIVEYAPADGAVVSVIPVTEPSPSSVAIILGRFSDGSFLVRPRPADYCSTVLLRTGHWRLRVNDHDRGCLVGATISPDEQFVQIAFQYQIVEVFADDGTVRGMTSRLTTTRILRAAQIRDWRCYMITASTGSEALTCVQRDQDWSLVFGASGEAHVRAMAVDDGGQLLVAGDFWGHGYEGSALEGLRNPRGTAIFVSTIAFP
jgi:hypothetical protein